ncbi:MAG: HAD-IIIA family hydrolase [Euryarchaeota archaeon]|jgi:histidinol-phosphate phosphatase family protein|nr:HAD-IIIA family hydrolase [Euryarchaeota archaeon]MBT5183911.1 HAD-IIIA family hydrolase [Euryarchaeota archaeon]
MEGPITEVNLGEIPLEWNGAIAFLDRDGVLNYGSPNYINSPNELVIIPGVKEAVIALRKQGYRIVVVTNQSAIMRGHWGEERIHSIHEKLQEEIGAIDVLMTCPHRNRDRCQCRKPQPGMLNHASQLIRKQAHSEPNWWGAKPKPFHELDLMVGDRNSDMGAGWAIGARLFKVDEEVGIPSVIERIILEDVGDEFNPVG